MLADLHVSYVVFMFGWAGLPPLAFVGPSCLMLRVFLFSVSWLVLMWARLASRWARSARGSEANKVPIESQLSGEILQRASRPTVPPYKQKPTLM